MSLATALEAKDRYTRGHSERVAALRRGAGRGHGPLPGRAQEPAARRPAPRHRQDRHPPRVPEQARPPHHRGVRGGEAPSRHRLRDLQAPAHHGPAPRPHPRPPRAARRPRLSRRPARREEIPAPLRCLTIADVYDALTSDRAYRKAMPAEKALEIMRQEASVGMWDTHLIDTFAEVVLKAGVASPPPGVSPVSSP